jgi:hypothetical protein
MGKTKYNGINLGFSNIVYFRIWFILVSRGVAIMSMDNMTTMFGVGNIVFALTTVGALFISFALS